MRLSEQKKTQIVVFFAALFAAAMMLFPETTERGTKVAISMWLNAIVPVMLPFYIFSDFIKRTGDLSRLPVRIYPMAAAFLSGYPMGAKITADFVKEKKITAEQGKYVLSYSFITGPAFILFTAGELIGSRKAAVIMAAAHYTGALINGLLYRQKLPAASVRQDKTAARRDYLENFTGAILDGFRAMAMILAYVMVFMIGLNILEHLNFFDIIENETAEATVKGIFEMTVGVNLIGTLPCGLPLKTVLSSFVISFGGLSVAGQAMSMTRGSGIGIRDILKIKTTHGLISAVIAVAAIWTFYAAGNVL